MKVLNWNEGFAEHWSTWLPTEPVAVDGVPERFYRSGPGWSSSDVKNVMRSPAYAKAMREGSEPTEAQAMGSLRHMLLLEPHLFSEHYWTRPKGMKFNEKDGKEWKAANDHLIAGKEEIAEKTYEDAKAWADRIKAHELWQGVVEGADVCFERSWYWIDEESGLLCKARTDVAVDLGEKWLILDAKSTRDATPEAFGRDAHRYGFHTSSAWYRAGVYACTGKRSDYILIAAEYAEPFEVNWYIIGVAGSVTEQARLGEQEARKGAALLAKCERENDWPTATRGQVTELQLPKWALREIEDESYDKEPF